jgi:membrane fusion protein, multidrug efflux system
MKKWISLAAIVLVLGGIAVFAYRDWRHSQRHPNTDDAYVGGDVFAVSSLVPGRLATVEVTENQPVSRGQVIATIDPRDYDAEVQQATAGLAEARSAIATNNAQIAQARARAAADASRLALARINLERFSDLFKRNSVPKQRYDDSVTAEQVAAADDAAARKALAAAEANLGVSEEKVKVQQSRLATAELTRSHCTITAPVDGVIARKSAQPGQVVAPGQPLCAVVPLSGGHIWVEANFKETDLRRIRVGLPATLVADVNPGRTYRGWVESLSAGTGAAFALLPPENATGNWVKIVQRLPVRIAIDPGSDTDHSLRLGLSVKVEVDATAEPRAVPAATPAAAPEPR